MDFTYLQTAGCDMNGRGSPKWGASLEIKSINKYPTKMSRARLKGHCTPFVSINTTGAVKKSLIHGRNRSNSESPRSQSVGSTAQLVRFLSVGKFQRCTGSHVVVVWVRGTVMRLWRKREEIANASCTTVLLYHFQVDTRPVRRQPKPRHHGLVRNSTAWWLEEVLHLSHESPLSLHKSLL